MKKVIVLLFCAFMLLTTNQVKSQLQKKEVVTTVSKDTSSAADTVVITFKDVNSYLKSFHVVVKKVSGFYSSGFVLLQASNDYVNWFNASSDTLKLDTSAAINQKAWEFTKTSFAHYRLWYKTAGGTQKSTLSVSYCRRPDEN